MSVNCQDLGYRSYLRIRTRTALGSSSSPRSIGPPYERSWTLLSSNLYTGAWG